ncbi:MAG: hypothetical protein AAF797_07060 [Planctomycetota bacterium]
MLELTCNHAGRLQGETFTEAEATRIGLPLDVLREVPGQPQDEPDNSTLVTGSGLTAAEVRDLFEENELAVPEGNIHSKAWRAAAIQSLVEIGALDPDPDPDADPPAPDPDPED